MHFKICTVHADLCWVWIHAVAELVNIYIGYVGWTCLFTGGALETGCFIVFLGDVTCSGWGLFLTTAVFVFGFF